MHGMAEQRTKRKASDNSQYLMPVRTPEEARERGARGGRASGVARRKKASLARAANALLALDSVDADAREAMARMGLEDDELTNASMVITRTIMRASAGDVRAVEVLAKLTSERDGADPSDDERALLPPFDLSANISPAFCEVSRAIESGIQEVVLKGGRGSAKSSYVYQKQLDVFLRRPNAMWLCMRRYANTLRRSCFASALWAVRKRGMTIGRAHEAADFTMTVAPMELTYNRTGQKIIFSGLDDPEKLKSITFEDPGKKVEILTWEEYSQFNPADVRNVEYSVLRSDYGLVARVFNPPPDAQHWANAEAASKAEDPAVLVHHSTWRDVPKEFLGRRFVENAERLYRESPEAAGNELDGETIELTGRVFPHAEDQTIAPERISEFKWTRCGLDWGFEQDPFVWLRVAYDRKTKELYIYDEIYNAHTLDEDNVREVKMRLAERDGQGNPLFTDDGQPVFRRSKPANEVRADAAGPKDIATWRHLGVEVVSASKRVPVDDGIRWLQKRSRIVIDRKRCPLAYQEFTRYRAVEDDGGRFRGYPDKDDHAIDAVRYAVHDLIADPECT